MTAPVMPLFPPWHPITPVPQAISPGCHGYRRAWEVDLVLNLAPVTASWTALGQSLPYGSGTSSTMELLTVPNSQCEDSLYLFRRGFGL